MDTVRPRDYDEIAALEQPSVISAMWRYRWLVALIVVGFIALGLAFNSYRPGSYVATADLIVEDPRNSSLFQTDILSLSGQPQTPQRYVADQVNLLESAAVAERAAELANPEVAALFADGVIEEELVLTAPDILRNSSAIGDDESNAIEISFSAVEPEVAQVGANAMLQAYEEVRREQVRQTAAAALVTVDELNEQLDEELNRIQGEISALPEDEINTGLDDARLVTLEDWLRLIALRENAAPGTANLDNIRAAISDRAGEITMFNLISEIQARDPNVQLDALLAEQQSVIDTQANLAEQRSRISVAVALAGAGIVNSSPAALPDAPSGAGPVRIVAASIVLGLAVSAAIAYFLAVRRRAFGNRLLPELVLNAPLLAEVPDFALEGIKSPLPVKSAPTSASAEAFRFAAAAVDIRATAAGARSLMVVSATLGSGKTTAAANTAIAAAREGLRVLVVDGDFGNQELSGLLLGDAEPDIGMTEVVEGLVPLEQALKHIVVTNDRSLFLLGRGRRPVEAANFFRDQSTQQFFSQVRDTFDLVIIDGPPLLQVAYASTLVRYVDAAVVIVPHNSRVGELEEVADRLHFIQTPAVGYIYTKAPLRPEMTASEGSMKDILGVGLSEAGAAAGGGRRRRGRQQPPPPAE